MSSSEARIKQLVDENFDLGREPDFDAKLRDSGVSSIEAVAFFKQVNQEYSLGLAVEDCLQFETLRQLVSFIDSRAG